MSSILHEDTFHGTKKGMRRKTVSKRRAYVNTPSSYKKKKMQVINFIDSLIAQWRQNNLSIEDWEKLKQKTLNI